MTLILNCLTPQYAIQVSDRRLVLPNGVLFDDHTNKSVLVNGNMVFSYTGLAFIDGKTRNDDWLLGALSDAHNEHPNETLTTTTEQVAERATRAIGQRSASQLAFVGVGWAKLPNDNDLRPLYLIISNSHSEKGRWLAKAMPQFSVLPFTPPENQPVMLVADGQPLGRNLRQTLLRQIHSCYRRGTGPKPIARLLVAAARTVAITNPKVGQSLLMNCIPRDSVHIGALRLFGASPNKRTATFTYIPEDTTVPVQYGPYVFAFGTSFKDMRVWQDREAI